MVNGFPAVSSIKIGNEQTGIYEYEANQWLKLIGLIVHYGFIHDTENQLMYILYLNSTLKQEYNDILDLLGINYVSMENEYFCCSISTVHYPHLLECFLKLDTKQNADKILPDYVWTLSKTQSKSLLTSIVNGSGNTMTYASISDRWYYTTKNKVLANEITRLALHCGFSGTIHTNENGGDRSMISVIIQKNNNQPSINGSALRNANGEIETVFHYNGNVYCIEMPSSHVYYMRETTNSGPIIVGNSSRHGQKGTCGNIIPECDMPYTKDGLRPDIIINPHAIPSRMTIAQLKETLLGKVLLELGLFGDGTSFGNMDIKTITEELLKLGYESYGNEVMYDGLTGRQMETSIFIGPVYYQRLKHMVNDKQHSRSIGPMVNLTRQPAEGRSRAGGFRVGEMERDGLIAHGMSRFCRERLYDVSDKYSVYVCKSCGMIASYNDGVNEKGYVNTNCSIHKCNTCDNMTDFARVEIPYAYKLLAQELQTINVVPRIITEN
jgi:hypothetical protein